MRHFQDRDYHLCKDHIGLHKPQNVKKKKKRFAFNLTRALVLSTTQKHTKMGRAGFEKFQNQLKKVFWVNKPDYAKMCILDN